MVLLPWSRRLALGLAVCCAVAPTHARAGEDDVLLELHFEPAENLQIAIWLETAQGEWIKDVLVTQATAKLGIGNRPGVWNFLSSWHAPYGPRRPVLPIWGHRRGKTYPAIIWHDGNPDTQTSLGFHEGTSSFEAYYCRPLKPSENDAVMDAMTCPSPQVFESDKGRFSGQQSPYPPRNDLVEFEPGDDHPDAMSYEAINDLDAVSGATPAGGQPVSYTVELTRDEAGDGPVVAFIEVSRETDENADWEYDRELDHFVDSKLPDYGIEWLGQPSVVYRVELDPADVGLHATDEYFGYGDWDGATGAIHPPDSTISQTDGSGADRLLETEQMGELFRFGVYSHGWGGQGGDGDDGGDGCADFELPPVEELAAEPASFDRVALSFRLPESLPASTEVARVRVFYQPSQDELDADDIMRGKEQQFTDCDAPGEQCEVEVTQLFGDFTYRFAVVYEDRCTNESPPDLASATTPVQRFQQIETFCFVATAAFGADWAAEVAALRTFRDVVLRPRPLGRETIRWYYAYGPALARLIASRPLLRAGARALLSPLAGATQALQRSGILAR